MITKDALTQANLLPVSLSLKRGLLRLRRLTAPSALPVIILRLISASRRLRRRRVLNFSCNDSKDRRQTGRQLRPALSPCSASEPPRPGSASSPAGRIRAGGAAEGHGAQLAVWLILAALFVAASVLRGWRPLGGGLDLGALRARLSAALGRCRDKTDDWITLDRRVELDERCVY